jgi:hypothetical protein
VGDRLFEGEEAVVHVMGLEIGPRETAFCAEAQLSTRLARLAPSVDVITGEPFADDEAVPSSEGVIG